MKKTYILGLMAAVLGFTACSSEDETILPENKQEGMVLKASVEETVTSRATIDDAAASWKFNFSQGDNVYVNNDQKGNSHYIFTKGGNDFTCHTAETTNNPVTWYAYFPQTIVYLMNQTGTKEGVANLYALSGATNSQTTGENGLNITMQSHVAILVIDNQRGSIDINAKTGPDSWVWALNAKNHSAGFDLSTSPSKVSLLTTNTPGTYYIAVPAGVQLSIKNGNSVLKSTGTNGLTAGKYYNLTIEALEGYADANYIGQVKWTQLWKNGPKWAEFNVGARSVASYGDYYSWGGTNNRDARNYCSEETLSGDYETATKLWGNNWRMPTIEELRGLRDYCDSEWTTIDGVNGFRFTGKTEPYTSMSIFLPAAGFVYYNTPETQHEGTSCEYWSSTPYFVDPEYIGCAYHMWLVDGLGDNGYYNEGNGTRMACYSVRPVLVE